MYLNSKESLKRTNLRKEHWAKK